MSTITFKGGPIQTNGDFPEIGQQLSDFKLVTGTLSEVSLQDFKGKRIVFNIFPSVDTAVCAMQLKSFSQKMAGIEDLILLSASLDLPFALNRFCGAEGIENAVTTSDFRHHCLKNYGVIMTDGPLAGLSARAVLILDEHHKIIYSELVNEVTDEPNYSAALKVLGIN
jgi:thiol peroxidase